MRVNNKHALSLIHNLLKKKKRKFTLLNKLIKLPYWQLDVMSEYKTKMGVDIKNVSTLRVHA